jgi:threonine aldolase
MDLIDLRSDTVTRPSPEMRRAMAEAEVGDDVFGDDPTVIALEERAAELLGKEAALFVPSGSMANLVAQMAHLARGDEAIAGFQSHIVLDEAAGHAVIVGASIRSLRETPDGTLDPDEVRAAFRDPGDVHEPMTGLIAIENTHAHSGGRPLDAGYTQTMAAVAREGGVPLHVDGARLFNAAVALGVPARDLVAAADSACFCLSKGLACPIGSLVVGRRDFIWRARRARKMVGGGMRQVGVLAAPGLIALRDGPAGMIERLAEDHVNARRLAEALSAMPGITSPGGIAQPEAGPLDPRRVLTNFVLFRVERDRTEFLRAMRARGVLIEAYPEGQIRAVTHYGITAADVERTVDAIATTLAETPLRPVAA